MRRDRQWRKRGTFIPEETRNIKKITCKVCGKAFYPKSEYFAKDRDIRCNGLSGMRMPNGTKKTVTDR